MTKDEYHTECRKIAEWADEQLRRKVYSEDFIERLVERKFDALDARYLYGDNMGNVLKSTFANAHD